MSVGLNRKQYTLDDKSVFVDQDVPATAEGRWVDLPSDERRGRHIPPTAAHGEILEDDASAVKRGRWVRERLFCQTVLLEFVQVGEARPPSPSLSAHASALFEA